VTAPIRKPDVPSDSATPEFSIITAVYNVEHYLPDFIASIEKQTFDLSAVEVIAVDDGSTDGSLALLQEWAARRPTLVTVLTKENGGQGSARNLGLSRARGEWVTFPDPDDVIEPNYLETVHAAVATWPELAMVAANRLVWNDATGLRTESHPLRAQFTRDRLVRLNASARYFHGSAPAAFMRREVVERNALLFDNRVRPNFEDGHFCSRYLLRCNDPQVAFLASAKYHYRKRNDGSSTLDNKRSNPGHFLDVPRHGYLAVLEEAVEVLGFVPEWLQSFIVYELSWYFTEDEQMAGSPSVGHGAVAEQFVALLRQIAHHLDPEVVMAFNVRPIKTEIKEILAYSLRGERYVTPFVSAWTPTQRSQSTRLAYRFTGVEPEFAVMVDGFERTPAASKVQAIRYFDHDLLFVRVIWITESGELRLLVDGRPLPAAARDSATSLELKTTQALRLAAERAHRFPALSSAYSPLATAWRSRGKIAYAVIDDAARSALPAKRFKDAWVLMDRTTDANDNAEHLFRYLRERRSDINAWFVLVKDCPDWRRLVRDGYGDRLVAFGSARWKVLMRHCLNLIVSHPNREILRPPSLRRYWDQWTVTFLQHGVLRDDISRWLNSKRFELFVTSTPAETESVTGDGTGYKFTSFQTKMVGLARFDRLGEIGANYPPEARDLVLIAPTWRELLNKPLAPGATKREIVDDFLETEFAKNWTAFISDAGFIDQAERRGKRVALLMHPNLQDAVDQLRLPPTVLRLGFDGQDVQQYFARAALMVTDYSSMTFNEAFLLRPTVYFQFDRDSYYNGANHARAGYFDHYRDGFGPVTRTPADAHEAVIDLLDEVPQEYIDRMERTFPTRDGRNRERTVVAIEDLHRPYAQRRLPSLLPE